MEGPAARPNEPEVPLGDAAIATQIAQAAARGRGADRAPTLEQLLAAFGEPAPTDAARQRVAAALRMAGMGVRPDLLTAEPGQRLLLVPPGGGGSGSRSRAVLGLAGLAVVIVAAAAGATLLEGGGDGDRASDSLPPETTTLGVQTPTTTALTDTTTTGTATTGTPTTETTSAAEQQQAAAAKRRRRQQAARRKRQREAAARRRATASKPITVRVDATRKATFLCVDDGRGNDLFSGTLSGKKVFKGRRIRLNIGLASTRVTVNGNAVRLSGSPDGLDITRAGGAKNLPVGKRPCS